MPHARVAGVVHKRVEAVELEVFLSLDHVAIETAVKVWELPKKGGGRLPSHLGQDGHLVVEDHVVDCKALGGSQAHVGAVANVDDDALGIVVVGVDYLHTRVIEKEVVAHFVVRVV